MFQYRASLVIWMIGQVLEPLVYLIVWSNCLQRQRRQHSEVTLQVLLYLIHHPDAGEPVYLYLGDV